MKVVINPKYSELTSFIQNIPEIFEQEGVLIYEARNQLKAFRYNNIDIIVKGFKKPHLINRIAYTFFRPSKAKRSYEYALELSKRDISTPEPIAYIETKKNGLLSQSYYISVFENDYKEIREQMLGVNLDDKFIKDLAAFLADIHLKGVLNNDLSPGNILLKTENGKNIFTLVDINRIKFLKRVSLKQCYKSFDRICERKDIIDRIATEYATVMQLDKEESIREINKYISRYSKNYKV